jgi:hypothetical protein
MKISVKEYEGKRFVEFNSVLIVIITSMVCLVIGMFILIWVLDSKGSAITNDPFIFGAKIFNVTECSCFNQDGVFYFNQEKVWKVYENKNQGGISGRWENWTMRDN